LTSLPRAEFWTRLKKLQVLFLHDNPLSNFRTIDRLAACTSLTVLTIYDTALSLRPFCRHHVVNTIWSLKAVDNYVISDEEIIDGATFGGRFAALSPHFFIEPCRGATVSRVTSTWLCRRAISPPALMKCSRSGLPVRP
jgi:hypothetical protein